MSTMMSENGTTTTDDVTKRVENLEKTLAGAQATQAAAHAGTWTTMAAGSIALIVGMFLGLAINKR